MIYSLLSWAVILVVPVSVIAIFARDYVRQERTRVNMEKMLGINNEHNSR